MKIGSITKFNAFVFTFKVDADSMTINNVGLGQTALTCRLMTGEYVYINNVKYIVQAVNKDVNPFEYTLEVVDRPLSGMEVIIEKQITEGVSENSKTDKETIQVEVAFLSELIDLTDATLRYNFESLEEANKSINRLMDKLDAKMGYLTQALEDINKP